MRVVHALCLIAFGIVPAGAAAQEPEPPDGVYQVFAEELVLGDLVEFWARRLDISIEFDPDGLDATVTVRTPPGLTEEAFWALTNRLLVAHDFACIQLPGEENLSVVPLAEAATSARIEPDPAAARAGYVRVLRPVEHVAPEDASEAVGGVLTGVAAIARARNWRFSVSNHAWTRTKVPTSILRVLSVPNRKRVIRR